MAASENYIQNIIRLQPQLYAYILTLVNDVGAADDVLQETNLVLWRKFDEYNTDASFEGWAFRIARFQCLNYWKIRARDRLVFDEAELAKIAERAEQRLTEIGDQLHALRHCLSQLTPRQRELLEGRYGPDGSVKQLATDLGRTEGAISQALYRIRSALLDCIHASLSQTERAC